MSKFNEENFRKVLNQIKSFPETWNQDEVHCGSAHCFFGWAQIMAGHTANKYTARIDGRTWLGVTAGESFWLFENSRTIEDFEWFAASPDNRKGRDRNGFDWNGRDIAGFDNRGYDVYGYDLDGFDEQGYDTKGYNRDGLDRKGFDAFGYDSAGFNYAGRNRDGFDRSGYDQDGLDANFNRKPQP